MLRASVLAAVFVPVVALPLSAQVGPKPDPGSTEVAPPQARGTVSAADKPVAGATVHVVYRKYPLAGGTSSLAMETVARTVQTGADGGFAIEVPPFRYFSIHATHDGKASKVHEGMRAPVAPLALELVASCSIRAQLEHEGKPLGQAIPFRLVRVSPSEHSTPVVHEAKTDANGQIVVEGLVPGPWRLELAAGAYRLVEPVVLENADKAQPVRVASAVTLEGAFGATSSAEQPIAGARVELLDPMRYYTTKTDLKGRFQIPGAEVGPGVMLLLAPEGYARRVVSVMPGLSPSDPAPQIRLSAKRGRTVRGRLMTAGGAPAANVEVLVQGWIHTTGVEPHDVSVLTKTDANGAFVTSELDPSAAYRLFAVLPSGEPQEIGMTSPREPQENLGTIRLGAQRGEVDLRFVDGPVPDLELRLYGPRTTDMATWEPLLPSAKGTYLTPCVREGEYVIVAVSPSHGLARAKLTVERHAERTSNTPLAFAKGRTIEGIVHDPGGKPEAGVDITIMPHGATAEGGTPEWTDMIISRIADTEFPAEKHPRQTKTDASGKFSLWCYEPTGKWDLVASVGGQPIPGAAPTDAERSARIEHVTSRSNPIRIDLR